MVDNDAALSQTTLEFLDTYCERAGHAGLWAEPINALTNLFFIYVAYRCWQQVCALKQHSVHRVLDIWLLIVSLVAIGVGSGLWHTVATKEAMLADVIPITVFINIYLIAAMRRILQLRWWKVIGLWAAYQMFTVLAQMHLSADLLHGSIMYLPTYVTLVLLTVAVFLKNNATGLGFITALGIFSLSLIFRTIDLWVCPIFPLGTHFLWHTLNAVMLYQLVRLVMGHIQMRA